MTDGDPEIEAATITKLEEAWHPALEAHTNEIRRSLAIGAGFYEKLAGLDAGSIAIAASVGIAVATKSGISAATQVFSSHWLVWIIGLLWFSLVCAVIHNFLVVWIARFDAKSSELTFVRTLTKDSLAMAARLVPQVEPADMKRVEEAAGVLTRKKQQQVVQQAGLLQKSLPIAGYISISAFVAAYTLIFLWSLRLWL